MPRFGALRPATVTIGMASAALGIWLSGCNVFSPLAADSNKDLTYHGLILKGNQAINDGDYAAATEYFQEAMDINIRGSEAFLYQSKALMNQYHIDYNTLNNEFNLRRDVDGKGKKGIPFIDTNTTVESIDSIFYPIAQSVTNLEHILRHEKDTVDLGSGFKMPPDGDTADDGKISEGVARLDLGLLQTVKGMLGPLDLDGDNHISRHCGQNVCPSLDSSCMATPAYTSLCKDGPASEVNRLESFKNLTKSIDINNLDTKDVRAREVSTNPNDINAFLDKMQGPIAGSSYNLDSVTGAMNSHGDQKLSGQLTQIVTNIADLSNFLSYMRYNDFIDNDFDDQDSSGKGTRMVWHDYDKDGGIRWNYDDDSLAGYGDNTTPQNFEGHNIGHPLHRYLHPDLYYKFTDPGFTSRKIAADTSANGRKAHMIKHCQDVVDEMGVVGLVTDVFKLNLKTKTCSTYTSILKSWVRPPVKNGVVRSDWQSGTFGIDEEEIDDRDNDYDGLKDEDARNAPGMDDDDDALLDVSMVGTNPPPMQWHDVAGHENKCPDIDTTQPMPAPPFQRQFCIGALEHRIYLAQHGGRDSLVKYYSEFKSEGGNQNCLDTFTKLDSLYKKAVGLSSTSDNDVQLACKFKHIWIHGRPPNSEWTGGTFGIDEEKLDGVDNDGDGWIDEDVGQ